MKLPPIHQLCEHHSLVLNGELEKAAVDCFARVQAHEGTLWLLDESRSALVPVWNSGPMAEAFVGTFRQPLDAGLISLVAITQQAICENEVCLNERQDPSLDQKLGLRTWSMIATPFVFHDALRGVISCVKLGESEQPQHAPPRFTSEDLREVERLSERLNLEISRDSRKAFKE